MKHTRKLSALFIVLAVAVVLVVGSAAAALAAPADQGCNQTPYENPGNGANRSGVYDDTCDGSASGNGNGGGKAVGKPCAGCVGKADEKNPPGQDPNADEDGNNGYECDNNSGIGKTNPAHTGCQPSGEVTPPPPEVGGTTETNPPGDTNVLGTRLAKTGAFDPMLVLFGLALLASGVVLRKRSTPVLQR